METDLAHFWREIFETVSAAGTIAISVLYGAYRLGENVKAVSSKLANLEMRIGDLGDDVREIKNEMVGISVLNTRMDSIEKRVSRVEDKRERVIDAVD